MPAATAQANAVTEKLSSTAIQNMLNITVSEVLYARELLPRENFTRVKMAGNTLHKMKDPDEEDNSKVAILNRWLKHDVCEALRKRVLQRMDLGIYSNAKCADKHLIESYSFLFTKTADDGYNMVSEVTKAKGETSQISRTTGEVLASMEPMVRTLQTLLDTMDPIPEDHFIAFQITLEDGSTTDLFETSEDFHDDTRPESELPEYMEEIGIGKGVATEHHSLAIKVKTRRSDEYDEGDMRDSPMPAPEAKKQKIEKIENPPASLYSPQPQGDPDRNPSPPLPAKAPKMITPATAVKGETSKAVKSEMKPPKAVKSESKPIKSALATSNPEFIARRKKQADELAVNCSQNAAATMQVSVVSEPIRQRAPPPAPAVPAGRSTRQSRS